MAPGLQTLNIKSDVFKWLFENFGCTTKEVAEALDKSEEDITLLLTATEDIPLTLKELKTLADLYHCSITAFLLPKAPKTKLPKDFRRAPGAGGYSKSLYKIFNRARCSLEQFIELKTNMGETAVPYLPKYTLADDPFQAAEDERRRIQIDSLNISRNAKEAYNQWREILPQFAIPVFQYNMDRDKIRGFVIHDTEYAAIAVNSSDTETGRIFTIFHEYAHLLLGSESLCTDDEGTTGTNPDINKIEHWCDNFSGAFLIPKTAASNNPKVTEALQKNDYRMAAKRLARTLPVSEAAALVRLSVINHIPYEETAPLLDALRQTHKPFKITEEPDESDINDETETSLPKKKGGVDPAVVTVAELGPAYLNLAARNYEEGRITYAGYLDSIGLSKSSHERLQKKGAVE